MRILAIGDVVGRPGRQVLEFFLPKMRETFAPDFVLLNGENSAGGFGLTEKIFRRFIDELHINCVTMGNHWADKREIYNFAPKAAELVLPANMMNVEREDMGFRIFALPNGCSVAVVNLIGRVFMNANNRCPFKAVDWIWQQIPSYVKIRIVDMHAEATSEKQAIAWHLAGKASLVYGTHSHVPSADHRILQGSTGFVTDLGMTGPYDSVIGMRKEIALLRMITQEKKSFEPAKGDPWVCFIVVDCDPVTGNCKHIERHIWRRDQLSD